MSRVENTLHPHPTSLPRPNLTHQWRIQNFQYGSGENLLFDKIFDETCMKMKEIGPRGGASP